MKNGVIVLDTELPLSEGQAFRIEPLGPDATPPIADERAAQLGRMKTLFTQWDEEDGRLSDEEADRLQVALQQNRGLAFRTPQID